MTLLNNVPFVKILVPFVAGILLVNWYEEAGVYSDYALIAISAIFAFAYLFKRFLHHYFYGLLNIVLFFTLGVFLSFHQNPNNHSHNLTKAGTAGVYVIRVDEIPQEKAKSIKFVSQVRYKIFKNSKIEVNEKVICYLKKNSKTLKPGDILSLRCSFKEINEPENLYQFNYKKFLKRQGIFYMTFINDSSNQIQYHGNRANIIEKFSYNGVVFLKQIFEKSIKDTVSRSIAESLVFGYKEDLPKNLIESYSKTGTLHVLAVSGMHVALVFFLLSKILWFLDFKKNGKYIKSLLVIFAVWGYCIITGFSPSVIRAGVMITLMITGKMLNRNVNVYNVIFATAFIILLINPFWLFNVGFQLSFAAVVGIVFLQQYLKGFWSPQNRFFELIWEIIVISVSAQIATFPLCLHYFSQFPNYFILSNLVIIPLTTFIIYLGTLLIIFYKIAVISNFLSLVISFFIGITNKCVTEIEKLPYSFIDGVKVTSFQALLIYLIIGFFIIWLLKNDKKVFSAIIICAIIFFSISLFDKLILQKEKTVVLFDIPRHNAILLSDGESSVVISDKSTDDNLLFYLRGYLIEKRIFPVSKYYTLENFEKINFKDKNLNLMIKNSVINFRNFKLKICKNSLPDNSCNLNYIIPNHEILNNINETDLCNGNFILGRSKDKKMSKKFRNILSECQKNAIKSEQEVKFKVIQIQ